MILACEILNKINDCMRRGDGTRAVHLLQAADLKLNLNSTWSSAYINHLNQAYSLKQVSIKTLLIALYLYIEFLLLRHIYNCIQLPKLWIFHSPQLKIY